MFCQIDWLAGREVIISEVVISRKEIGSKSCLCLAMCIADLFQEGNV